MFFLQTPFDDFNFLIDFIVQASKDPNVVSIKQTIYRCPVESPLVNALIFAARSGKKVSIVVETRASMDEQNNILIAEKLRQNGANLAYGKPDGLTHAKLCLISQIKEGKTRNFLHVGTGNYHADNASRYTDFSLFTSSEELCRGAENLFNNMFNLNNPQNIKSNYFYVSGPNGIKDKLISLILSEIDNKKNGKVAGIFLKCSRLLDPDIIQHLYMASQAGVPCELIIRSVCALQPGVKGISENIRVKSIVGPFLEHSRAYCFCQRAPLGSVENKVFISSADLMRRGFEKRVEIMVMILDSDIRKRITREIFLNYIEDNQNSWILNNNGSYLKIVPQKNQELNVYKQLMYKKI